LDTSIENKFSLDKISKKIRYSNENIKQWGRYLLENLDELYSEIKSLNQVLNSAVVEIKETIRFSNQKIITHVSKEHDNTRSIIQNNNTDINNKLDELLKRQSALMGNQKQISYVLPPTQTQQKTRASEYKTQEKILFSADKQDELFDTEAQKLNGEIIQQKMGYIEENTIKETVTYDSLLSIDSNALGIIVESLGLMQIRSQKNWVFHIPHYYISEQIVTDFC
jgi:hypothetical protein